MKPWDLLGLGAIAVDDLIAVASFPQPDTKAPVLSEQRQGGGLTATALVAASRLGARTAFLGVLGDDELSQFSLRELQREGVDCGPVIRRAGARPFHSTIIVEAGTGRRTILHSSAGVTYPEPGQVTRDLVASCKMLFLDHTCGAVAAHALELARQLGVPVIADVESATGAASGALLQHADHLIVGLDIARQATGWEDPAQAVAALARPDRDCCAVTAGAAGCWYSAHGGPVRHFPAFQVQAVDTTGCGDVFHGAYAASIAGGESIDRAIQVATAAAALKATRAGGRTGIPDRAAVERFLSPVPNPQPPIPVGIFDSGVGGLSVALELMRQQPAQPIIYLADQANTPYGQRPLAEIRRLAKGITRFLLGQGARVVVVACNTASAAALNQLRDQFPEVPFVGMEPAVKPAAEHTHIGRVGVIATAATFQGELFASLIDRYASDVSVHTQVCPALVPLVEAGEIDSDRARTAVRGYLRPLLDAGIDELVLGCTHYPFLRPLIQEVAGACVEIIDPAPAVARQTGRVLARHGWLACGPATLEHRFYTTGDTARFGAVAQALTGLRLDVRPARWLEPDLLAQGEPPAGTNPRDIPNGLG